MFKRWLLVINRWVLLNNRLYRRKKRQPFLKSVGEIGKTSLLSVVFFVEFESLINTQSCKG